MVCCHSRQEVQTFECLMGKFEEVSDDAADDDELEVHNVKLITF